MMLVALSKSGFLHEVEQQRASCSRKMRGEGKLYYFVVLFRVKARLWRCKRTSAALPCRVADFVGLFVHRPAQHVFLLQRLDPHFRVPEGGDARQRTSRGWRPWHRGACETGAWSGFSRRGRGRDGGGWRRWWQPPSKGHFAEFSRPLP